MEYVCEAPHGTWFRLDTESEAMQESAAMEHAVEKFFGRSYQAAVESYVPPAELSRIEQSIGRKSHIKRTMPMFVTLRDNEGNALVTAMLPPGGKPHPRFDCIVVGKANSDPYLDYAESIQALAKHTGIPLDADACYPYRRG
jgi:hypothetical protein